MVKKSSENEDFKVSKLARAKRLLLARNLLGLSRNSVGERHGIPRGSLQNWETPIRREGLTENGAKRVVKAFSAEGLNITYEWLMFGIGAPPQITNRLISDALETIHQPEDNIKLTKEAELTQISKELLLFREAYAEHVDLVVTDDAMLPRFIKGEFVAGRRRFGKNIETALQQDCIVHLANNEILLRNLKVGSKNNLYTLACTNPYTTVEKPFLYDVEVLSAAPVIWTRRQNPE